MESNTIAGLMGGVQNSSNQKPEKNQDSLFADQLNQANSAASAQGGNSTIGVESDGENDGERSAFDYIKEHGFTAYLEKLRVEKMEELREKLLKAMGLSEEDLQNMPVKQRAAIEDRIAEEIKRRMAATAESNKDEKTPNDASGTITSMLSSRPGIGNGLALMQVLEQRQVAAGPMDEE